MSIFSNDFINIVCVSNVTGYNLKFFKKICNIYKFNNQLGRKNKKMKVDLL